MERSHGHTPSTDLGSGGDGGGGGSGGGSGSPGREYGVLAASPEYAAQDYAAGVRATRRLATIPPQMQLAFDVMKRYGYDKLMWAFDAQLRTEHGATIQDSARLIAQTR